MEGNFILFFLVLFPMVSAIVSYLIGRKNKQARNSFAAAVTVIEVLVLLYLFMVPPKETEFVWNGFCARGLYLKLDGFRVLYAGIAAFMWMMTTIFSAEYFAHYRNRNRYYLFVLLTLGATVGVFLSSDLFTTFIFFEIMSFTSYVWVAQDEKEASLRAAGTYLAVAVIGGLVMLMGLFLLYNEVGTLRMSELLEACQAVEDKTMLYAAGGLILFGFGAKAGMYPLHIWLPKAHPVAPAPASALLSGILTKSGVFGILVISSEIFLHDEAWGKMILLFGVITMFLGAFLALFSIDLKRTLALSSMSQIGFILVGIGMQGILGHHNALAVRGTLLHMVNHSLIKLVLFMAAGVVYMNLHKLDLNSIRGFGRKKPLLKISFLMGTLGIMGIPLWNGYISKTLLHESIVEYIDILQESGSSIAMFKSVEWIFLITGGLTIAYMLKLFIAVFVEKNPKNQEELDEKTSYMNGASTFAICGSAVILPILGFLPTLTMNKIAELGQKFMHGESPEHAVHYFNMENLKGAIISLVIGIVVYVVVVRLLMMKTDEEGNRVYINAWPEWLDLENLIYRPILLSLLPFLGALVSRIVERLTDGTIKLLQRTLFRAKREERTVVGTRVTDFLGKVSENIVICYRKVMHKETEAPHYVEKFAEWKKDMDRTGMLIRKSLSFGLLMFCIGLALTLSYLLM